MLLGDLGEYVAPSPRVTALRRWRRDGSWLAVVVQTVGGEPPKYLSGIWRIDTEGDFASRSPAHPQCRGRGKPRVPARRLAAVRVEAP